MSFFGQKVLPAIRKIEDVEKMMSSNYEYIVILDLHVSRLKPIFQMAQANHKKLIIHMDLVHGLKSDEYSTEYICQEYKPFGLISTKGSVILKARQRGVKSIQRLFLLDTSSIEKSFALIERTQPDYIEVLPGIMPKIIKDIRNRTKREVFAGGLIDTIEEVEQAYEAGAITITTSNKELWKYYHPGKKHTEI
ncbi:glycerol-3-phosphate responsive antiterminator [Neobacillus vireti]|uniref:Glycerol uptake operon antiterminator regulatory protein n=1 Tax=Neobacillus vireti LMG 21834 TaxID=1131730 RepID=A0AB94IJL0_9BACI|nr:glycerol-3-phosphate responsive antiterminator [Neobacillus vireti]ETI67239.1 glycerol-3-phosphate responsive antiterminator GlpP [Neobacillus vireti LMG 21834]KLT17926.1 glycerol-3-phosphate responsive antiterminator GlpP [Neobacillus vireti]